MVEKVNNDLSKIKNLIKEKKNNILNLSNKKEFEQIALHICKLIMEHSSGIEIHNIQIIPKIIRIFGQIQKLKI